MDIREASPEDAAEIEKVIQKTWTDAYIGVEPEEKLDEISNMDEIVAHEKLQSEIEDTSTMYLVAEEGDLIIGEAIVVLDGGEEKVEYPEEAFLRSLYVLPDHQGKGAGSTLLNQLEAKLPKETERLKTMVLEENTDAVDFYQERGFTEAGRTKFGGGEGSLLAREHRTLILEKDLEKK